MTMQQLNYEVFTIDPEVGCEFNEVSFEEGLDRRNQTTFKAIEYRYGYTNSAKRALLTEAIMTLSNGVTLILGTTYGKRDAKGKLHPVSSYYKEDGKVTEALKPVQRKGIVPASEMLCKLYNVSLDEFVEVITESRKLENYNIQA